MSEAILSAAFFRQSKTIEPAQDMALPHPQPFGAPVLLTDAVTPLAGETLLSLLMKRMAEQADQDLR